MLCGREVDDNFMMVLLNTLDIQNNTEYIICEAARNVMHIRFIEIPKFQDEYHDKYCRQLRINFMRNKINKEEFKYLIQKKNKDFQKKKELFEILIMYINCMTDIFYIMLNNKKYSEIGSKQIFTKFTCSGIKINIFCLLKATWRRRGIPTVTKQILTSGQAPLNS